MEKDPRLDPIFPYAEGETPVDETGGWVDDTTPRVEATLFLTDQELSAELGRLANNGVARQDYVNEMHFLALHTDRAETAYARERTRRKEAEHQLTIDAMTGLLNKEAWRRNLDAKVAEMEAAVEAGEDPGALAVLFLDADSFKRLNDKVGHDKGDQLIILMGNILATQLRTSKENTTPDEPAHRHAGRLGGDEFVISQFFPPQGTPDTREEGGRRVNQLPYEERIQAIKTRIETSFMTAVRELDQTPESEGGIPGLLEKVPHLGVTIGHVMWESGLKAHTLEKAADKAMLELKQVKKDAREPDTDDTYVDTRD